MDTTKPSAFSISPHALASLRAGPNAPLLIDVRKNAAFAESSYTLPGASRSEAWRQQALPVLRQSVAAAARFTDERHSWQAVAPVGRALP